MDQERILVTTTTTALQAESRIFQLCCLGLSSEVVMSALLEELHHLVPSYSNSFMWSDEGGQVSNVYEENPDWLSVQPVYVEHFYNTLERAVHPGFSAAIRSKRGVVPHGDFFLVDQRTLRRSDFYNLVMRPMNCDRLLQLFVHDGIRPLGVLQMQRGPKEREFTDAEALRLGRLAPFLAHALAARPPPDATATVESGESGLIMVDTQGRLLGCSPQGRRLLYLATHPDLRHCVPDASPACLPPAVLRICMDLVAVGKGDVAAPPPVIRHRNPWGVFEFRAHPVDGGPGMARQIGIAVTREVPLMLRLTRGAHRLGLSRRQSEIAVLLGAGRSHREIADRFGISRNTVISHSRWIYSKLDVHDTLALRDMLLRSGAAD